MLKEVVSNYRQDKSALLSSFKNLSSTRSLNRIHRALQELRQLTDRTLKQLWKEAGLDLPYALIAVGGYGRGELFPYSDVDVLLLLPRGVSAEQDPVLQKKIEKFIGLCWDSGHEIGSSVRNMDECMQEAKADITVQTSLLESRCVEGDQGLFQSFVQLFNEQMDAKAFFIAKTLEMQQRHTKFENTPYSLEPNCKESPGGLRDLQMLLWLTKAAGFGSSWDELQNKGLATPLEIKQIKHNESLLSLIRLHLHLAAKRREDRLVFDLQSVVAQSLQVLKPHMQTDNVHAATEALMKLYYWAAKAVTQLNQILLLNIEEALNAGDQAHQPQAINERFANKAGMLEVMSDDLYLQQPHAILETFYLYQSTLGIKGLSVKTLRALYNARGIMDAKFRSDPANSYMFMKILKQPQGITHAMRLMNQTSVLGRYLWVFRRIVGQMQHDLFHVYTVDQHILMVLRNVRRFFIVEHTHEYPFLSQLAAGWDKPWLLFVAALFHDIAKGRGGDHSTLGCMEVRRFCKQHHIPREDAKLIEFLVKEHLTMSKVAQKEDLSDPQVIQNFAKRVGSERKLTALYLLTVADIRGTSPKVWNAWKGKLMADLFRYTLQALGGRAPDPDAMVESRRRDALEMLSLYAMPYESHKNLWDTLDVGYFMRHDAADIAWHTSQLSRPLAHAKAKQQAPGVSVKARLSPLGEGLQVMVYTPDQTDLFARICGYFDQAGFSILDAKIHTANNGYALDTFQVVTEHLQEHYREIMSMVETDLTHTIEKAGPLPAGGRGRVSRRVKSFPVAPRVSLQPDEKAQRWLLSISASDRVGLLYSVARILAKYQINLQLAKVTTLGERVEDTFLIDGAALQHNKTQLEIETELLTAMNT